jgi:NAD-dependent DNA ligase
MSFQVFRYIKGGRKRLKGKIIVKAVEADMAKVTIVEGARLKDPVTKKILVLPLRDDPIVKGDLIRTPLFDRNEQQVFVFLGDKPTNTIYKKKELERKIEEAGGKVDKEVSIATDFVILLGGAEDEERDPIDKAGQFGCIFMRESELLEYLSR